MADNSKTLSKLIIHSFEKNDFQEEDPKLTFTTPINPETFTKTSHIELEKSRAHGQAGTDIRYKSTAPEELKIEFILDGTKTLEGYVKEYKSLEVTNQIKKFTDCVYKYEGKIHRPRFLIVHWGSDLTFKCVLSHMDVNYSLFKPNGDPLRAKVTASFIAYETPKAVLKEKRTASPDLTHYRVVKQGDRLDRMTFKIYDDSGFFLQVASTNNLSNIRKLQAGSELYFPPISKNDE